jgi:hypothetical protein
LGYSITASQNISKLGTEIAQEQHTSGTEAHDSSKTCTIRAVQKVSEQQGESVRTAEYGSKVSA